MKGVASRLIAPEHWHGVHPKPVQGHFLADQRGPLAPAHAPLVAFITAVPPCHQQSARRRPARMGRFFRRRTQPGPASVGRGAARHGWTQWIKGARRPWRPVSTRRDTIAPPLRRRPIHACSPGQGAPSSGSGAPARSPYAPGRSGQRPPWPGPGAARCHGPAGRCTGEPARGFDTIRWALGPRGQRAGAAGKPGATGPVIDPRHGRPRAEPGNSAG